MLMYITCKDSKEAEKISMHLLKKRLIACANIFPIKSIYRWEKEIVSGREAVILAKTSKKKFKRAVYETKRVHSYKIPCILKIDSQPDSEYERWAEREMR